MTQAKLLPAPRAAWRSMPRAARIAIGFVVAVVLLLLAASLVLKLMFPPAEIARRIELEASDRLGVPVHVGSLSWSAWPLAYLVARDVHTEQEEPIRIGRIGIYPQLRALMNKQIRITRLEVEHAVVPRNSLKVFRGREADATSGFEPADTPLETLVLRDVTYVSWSGIGVAYDLDAEFDPHWRPRTATVSRPGVQPPAHMTLTRMGDEDRWTIKSQIAGGTLDGEARFEERDNGQLALNGTLEPKSLDVVQFLDAFNRNSPVGGRASGHTVFRSRGETAGELARAFYTGSDLSVQNGVVLKGDLDRAVKTMGKEHAGQTPLDSLTARVEMQNTENGMRVTYSNVKGTSGKYTATGEAVVYQRQIQAKGTLDIVDGLVGVPFTATGPVKKPEVHVPKGFFAGAAIGTAILPGIGTVIGARIGGALSGATTAGREQAGAKPAAPAPQKTSPRMSP